MSLAVFKIEFQGLLRRGTTSENTAAADSLIGLDALLTNAARALYGYLVDPEIDILTGETGADYRVNYGFRQNIGMARRAVLSGNAKYIRPDPRTVLSALGFCSCSEDQPQEGEIAFDRVNGLVDLLKKIDGRTIDRVYITTQGTVDVEVGDDAYRITNDTYRLLRHIGVRKGLQQLLSALSDPHVARIVIFENEDQKQSVKFDAGDIVALEALEPEEVLLVDEVRTMALQLSAPVFRSDKCWTFTDGLQTICAQMKDGAFLRLIDNGVFAAKPGEILVVNMHVRTVETTQKGLLSTYEILRVIDHRKPGKHLLMPGI